MYQFNAIVTNDYTIDVISNTYWNCKAEGNFKLSQYDGSGNTKIDIEIPGNIMLAEGTVYFSYGDERCKYPKLSLNLANLCYITSYPNYSICDNGEKTIYFFYTNALETFNVSIFCYDGWTVNSADFNYITNNNEVMIIASGNDGELRIIPNHQCGGRSVIHIKLVKKKADS